MVKRQSNLAYRKEGRHLYFTFEKTIRYKALGERHYHTLKSVPLRVIEQGERVVRKYATSHVSHLLAEDRRENKKLLNEIRTLSLDFTVTSEEYAQELAGRVEVRAGQLVVVTCAPYSGEVLLLQKMKNTDWMQYFERNQDGTLMIKQHLRIIGMAILDDNFRERKSSELDLEQMIEQLNQ